jgi:biopolymer transport protein ExbD
MSRPEINVTPLIDVLLVLLIIFMIITPERPSKLEARVPSEPTDNAGVEPHPETLVVTVDRNSALSLNNEQLEATAASAAKLSDRLRGVFAERLRNQAFVPVTGSSTKLRIETAVFIKAPRSLSYGDVARVVDAVKAAGADPVSLQIDGL